MHEEVSGKHDISEVDFRCSAIGFLTEAMKYIHYSWRC